MGISTAIALSFLDGEVFFGKKSPPAQEVTLMPQVCKSTASISVVTLLISVECITDQASAADAATAVVTSLHL